MCSTAEFRCHTCGKVVPAKDYSIDLMMCNACCVEVATSPGPVDLPPMPPTYNVFGRYVVCDRGGNRIDDAKRRFVINIDAFDPTERMAARAAFAAYAEIIRQKNPELHNLMIGALKTCTPPIDDTPITYR